MGNFSGPRRPMGSFKHLTLSSLEPELRTLIYGLVAVHLAVLVRAPSAPSREPHASPHPHPTCSLRAAQTFWFCSLFRPKAAQHDKMQ